MKCLLLIVCAVLLAILPMATVARPMGGKFSFSMSTTSNEENFTCRMLGMMKGGYFTMAGLARGTSAVAIHTFIYESQCANVEVSELSYCSAESERLVLYAENSLETSSGGKFFLSADGTSYIPPHPPAMEGEGEGEGAADKPKRDNVAVEESESATNATSIEGQDPHRFALVNSSGVYVVRVAVKSDSSVSINVTLEFHNPYGYLSAIDYPALIFYSCMTVVYTACGLAWLLMMACSYKDLVRLQFWIGAVILLGLLEKAFFVSEYSTINQGLDSPGLILVAECISAAKRALARVLLIIVSLGFGTVKPRLGENLSKVVIVGVVYFIAAVIEGVVRSNSYTATTSAWPSTVTFAVLFILDAAIMWWIFMGLVNTRRTLRLRNNTVKLSIYNHFMYTLIFTVIASLVFTVWMMLEINYPKGDCLTDWKEIWLRDCFWHILFAFILCVIMLLWRPSANKNRFAYSLVSNEEEEDEEVLLEQLPNKNFDTVKMRQLSRSDVPQAPVAPLSSQAEDDLKWVEENLPTTAVDKALPLILDSDEEVMTTKLEVSKMN